MGIQPINIGFAIRDVQQLDHGASDLHKMASVEVR